ncbi:metallocarboxypeptidase, peptidase M14_like family protein [Psychroflexus gondwanensis ACAM 44]|uniref:Metallocarboxypeptidase, peptidase M14_like family protein n=1 Tax=Psychroflexus gondwanensis ACAM 44 TaxID=1189619 RepID=N1WWF5_9FLAO|nr:M14 family zinc carboxypeptidase [Psychroflexus gondwanensis]EMY81512.1 metallocarboxypeptidase, peptidase M14_like family protein [Psychroflexus gondwanensis ACAM 44]
MKLDTLDFTQLLEDYSHFKVSSLRGRYLKEEDLIKEFKAISHKFKINNEGYSEEDRIISSFHLGQGSRKILIWSQMHGNETTTTKAVLDLLNFFSLYKDITDSIFELCSFVIIPVLNPDGAVRYTRANANLVDLNRDASSRTQLESQLLNRVYTEFQPDFCFNMHDQRTIFSAGTNPFPATVSFLSPSFNEERGLNVTRKKSMSLIASASLMLEKFIPNQIGRYDDSFNLNFIGDFFQAQGTPTILFEAGHFPNDYAREETRKYIFLALLKMVQDICLDVEDQLIDVYFEIPENKKLFNDVIVRNVKSEDSTIKDIVIQYKEVVEDEHINFVPFIEKIEKNIPFFAHREINVDGQSLILEKHFSLKVGDVLSSFKVNDNVFVI